MAERVDVFSVNIDDGGSGKTLAELRQQIKDTRATLEGLTMGTDEFRSTAEKLADEQRELQGVMREVKAGHEAEEGSINALRTALADLMAQYNSTGEAAKRAQLAEQINGVKAKINEAQEAIGNFQHNVGNYANSIKEAIGAMGANLGGVMGTVSQSFTQGAGSVKVFGVALKTLYTNPIILALVAVIGLIEGAIKAVKTAINSSEEAQRKWQESMEKLRPVLDILQNVIVGVGKVVIDFVDAVIDAGVALSDFLHLSNTANRELRQRTKLEQNYATTLAQIADTQNKLTQAQLEGNKRAVRGYSDQLNYLQRIQRLQEEALAKEVGMTATEYKNLAKMKAELIDYNREWEVESAKLQNVYDQQRVIARDTSMSEEERQEALNEAAKAVEAIIAGKRKQLEMEQAIAKEETAHIDNSKAQNDKLAEIEAEIVALDGEEARMKSSLVRTQNSLNKATATGASNAKETTEAVKEEAREREKIAQIQKEIAMAGLSDEERELQTLRETYEERLALLEKYGEDTEALTEQYNSNVQAINDKYREQEAQAEENATKKQIEAEALARQNEYKQRALDASIAGETDSWEYQKALLWQNIEEAKAQYEALQQWAGESDEEYRARLLAGQQAYVDAVNELEAKSEEEDERRKKEKEQTQKTYTDTTTGLLNSASKALGESTKAGKAMSVASALISTYQGAQEVFTANAHNLPLAIAQMATALAIGFNNVRNILAVDETGETSAGSGSASSYISAIPNIQGLTDGYSYTRNLTTQEEDEQASEGSRVYILESDIQKSNKRVSVRESNSTY